MSHVLPIIDVGIDPGLSGAIAAIDAVGLVVLLKDMPVAALGAGERNIVDAGALARMLLDLGRDGYRLRVWLEQVGPGSGEGVSSVFAFGGAYRAAQAVVEALAETHPSMFTMYDDDRLASKRAAASLVLPARWARSAGLPPNRDRDARLKQYHAHALKRWPSLAVRGVNTLLGPKGGAKYDRAAALLIADHGRRLHLGATMREAA